MTTTDNFDNVTTFRDEQNEYTLIPIISLEQLQAVMDKWLLIADPGVVELLQATLIANKLEGDPVWLFLIAPSSGGKTELMNGLLKIPETYSLSQLTPNTFLSGYKSKDKIPSLLHQLGSGKTILFKDFTSLLDGNRDELKEIMGQFREIFDGHTTKRLGTGDELSWKGKLGFIAGCTPIIEQRLSMIGAMGERFLSYKMKQPRRAELRAKMKENAGKDGVMRDEIQDAMAGYQKGVVIPEVYPQIPDHIDHMIECLTDFIAITRSVVIRGTDNKKDIEYIVEPEMSGRVYKQFSKVAVSLLIMGKGEWHQRYSDILRNLAVSSVHSVRYHVLRCVASYVTQVKTSTIAMELGYPTTTMRRYLEDLAAITMDEGRVRILRRTHQGKGKPDLWELTPGMIAIMKGMGEKIEATKTDGNFEADEEDIPVTNTLTEDEDRAAYERGEDVVAAEVHEDPGPTDLGI